MPKSKPAASVLRLRKRLYDIEYRKANLKRIKRKKRAYNRTPAGRAMQKRNRIKMRESHLEYCRQPEYCKQKKAYDQERLAKLKYGPFWEVMILVTKIQKRVCAMVPDTYERMKMRGHIDRMLRTRARKMSLLYGWQA